MSKSLEEANRPLEKQLKKIRMAVNGLEGLSIEELRALCQSLLMEKAARIETELDTSTVRGAVRAAMIENQLPKQNPKIPD